jgi:hypothetical protein
MLHGIMRPERSCNDRRLLAQSERMLPELDVAEFEDLLDRLGEDLSAWPAAQQQAATSLLLYSAEARAHLAEARLLRQALTAAPVRASAGLVDRIMLRIRDHDAAQPTSESDSDPARQPLCNGS